MLSFRKTCMYSSFNDPPNETLDIEGKKMHV